MRTQYQTCKYCQTPIMRGRQLKAEVKKGVIYFHPSCWKKYKSYFGKEVKLDLWRKLKKILKP